jgi:hypothetical protein
MQVTHMQSMHKAEQRCCTSLLCMVLQGVCSQNMGRVTAACTDLHSAWTTLLLLLLLLKLQLLPFEGFVLQGGAGRS